VLDLFLILRSEFTIVVYDVNIYVCILITSHNGMASVKKLSS
jgi:hypothetical protein